MSILCNSRYRYSRFFNIHKLPEVVHPVSVFMFLLSLIYLFYQCTTLQCLQIQWIVNKYRNSRVAISRGNVRVMFGCLNRSFKVVSFHFTLLSMGVYHSRGVIASIKSTRTYRPPYMRVRYLNICVNRYRNICVNRYSNIVTLMLSFFSVSKCVLFYSVRYVRSMISLS